MRRHGKSSKTGQDESLYPNQRKLRAPRQGRNLVAPPWDKMVRADTAEHKGDATRVPNPEKLRRSSDEKVT